MGDSVGQSKRADYSPARTENEVRALLGQMFEVFSRL